MFFKSLLRLASIVVFALTFQVSLPVSLGDAAPTSTTVIRLPEVQGLRSALRKEKNPNSRVEQALEERKSYEITPYVGKGAAPAGPVKNERGVKITNAEGTTRTANPAPSLTTSGGSTRLGLGQAGFLSGGKQGHNLADLLQLQSQYGNDKSNRVEFFIENDRSSPRYVDENNTPYTKSDDTVRSVPLEKRTLYFSANRAADIWSVDATAKNFSRSRRSGILLVGQENEWGFFSSGTFLFSSLQVDPYLGGGWNRFQKKSNRELGLVSTNFNNLPQSARDQDARLGTKISYSFPRAPHFQISPYLQLEREQLKRTFEFSGANRRYEEEYFRSLVAVGLNHRLLFQNFHLLSDWSLTQITDSSENSQANRRPVEATPSSMRALTPKLAERFIFFPEKKWNLISEFLFENQTPTPLQKRGDGVLIQSNSNLPVERRVRFVLGPRWKHRGQSLQFSVFGEGTRDSPILVGSTPTTARYFALGGIWTRGASLRLQWGEDHPLDFGSFGFSGNWNTELQESLQNTNISWQRGQPAPGRPRFVSETQVNFHFDEWRWGSLVKVKTGEYRDLGGQLKLPTRFQFDSDCEIKHPLGNRQAASSSFLPASMRLAVSDIFAKSAEENAVKVAGAAGEMILEPELPERKVQLSIQWNW